MIAFVYDYQTTNAIDYGGLTATASSATGPVKWFSWEPSPDAQAPAKTKSQLKAERYLEYRAARARQALAELHFACERRPASRWREKVDPLRHQRQRGWRRASRRDQSQLRAAIQNKGRWS